MNITRYIPRIALCLLTGLALSYSVAWAIEYRASSRWLWSEEGHVITPPDGIAWPLEPKEWPVNPTPDVPDSVPTATIIDHAIGRTVRIVSANDRSMDLWAVQEIRIGWPLACCVRLEMYFWQAASQPRTPVVPLTNRWIAGIHAADVQSQNGPFDLPVVLPVKPLWTGLAVNSAFYGCFVATAAWLAGWAVRANRRRRGLCEVCKYPRGVSPVCTECGKPKDLA